MITSAENNALTTPTVIRLTDYGVLPDSGLDAQPAMVRAIQAVAEIPGPGLLDCRRALSFLSGRGHPETLFYLEYCQRGREPGCH